MELTQMRVWFNNPYIDLLLPPSVTREYYLNVLELLQMLSVSAHLQHTLPYIYGETYSNISVILLLIFIPAWQYAAENISSEC